MNGGIRTMLRLENISKSFGGLQALKNVSLTVNEGEIFGIIGPNGAGKTTLLNVIAGVHRPESGRVRISGEDVTGMQPHARCRRGLSRTFQIAQAFPQLSVHENVLAAATFGHGPCTRQQAEQRAREALDRVGFHLPVDTPAGKLNTAQLKRLDLARALASRPRVLLLDEIASGLTPGELGNLMEVMLRIKAAGICLIVVEHLMRLILQVCERVAFLESGEILVAGPPRDILKDARVMEAYLGAEH